jgi:hypothetical protein
VEYDEVFDKGRLIRRAQRQVFPIK